MGGPRGAVPDRLLPSRRARGHRQGPDADLRGDRCPDRPPRVHVLLRVRGVHDPRGCLHRRLRRPAGGRGRWGRDGDRNPRDGARHHHVALVRRACPRRDRGHRHLHRAAQGRQRLVSAVTVRHPVRAERHRGHPGVADLGAAARLAGLIPGVADGVRSRGLRDARRGGPLRLDGPRSSGARNVRKGDPGGPSRRRDAGDVASSTKSAHVAALSDVFLSLFGAGQPTVMGGSVPAGHLRSVNDGGCRPRQRAVARSLGVCARDGLGLGPAGAPPKGALYNADVRPGRALGRVGADTGVAAALGRVRPLLYHGDLQRSLRAHLAHRARGQSASSGRRRRGRREPGRIPRRRADPGPARCPP